MIKLTGKSKNTFLAKNIIIFINDYDHLNDGPEIDDCVEFGGDIVELSENDSLEFERINIDIPEYDIETEVIIETEDVYHILDMSLNIHEMVIDLRNLDIYDDY